MSESTKLSEPGWYECTYSCEAYRRVMWWDGKTLYEFHDPDQNGYDVAACTDFLGPLVPASRDEEVERLTDAERSALDSIDIEALIREVTGETAEEQVKRLSKTAMRFFRERCELRRTLKELRKPIQCSVFGMPSEEADKYVSLIDAALSTPDERSVENG